MHLVNQKIISRITFFRKVMKTTFLYESFLEFYSAHFGIKIEPCFIKKNFIKKKRNLIFISSFLLRFIPFHNRTDIY